jgi:gas vesicle protein
MSRDNGNATVIAAFLLGGLVGAAVALLTAPRSGKETRDEIGRWAEGATERAREKVRELYANAREKMSRHGIEPEQL